MLEEENSLLPTQSGMGDVGQSFSHFLWTGAFLLCGQLPGFLLLLLLNGSRTIHALSCAFPLPRVYILAQPC